MNIVENFNKIIDQIKSLNIKRNINVIAVTKTFDLNYISPIIDLGHIHFGENRVQEALDKWSKIKNKNLKNKLHLIGRLQSNKVEDACRIFDYIHSLDSEKLASKISLEQNKTKKPIKLFIQVNIGNEKQKNGIQVSEVSSFVKLCLIKYKLDIIGLMCIPPANQDPAPYFKSLKELAFNNGLPELSMGMSGDYLKAIECGSSFVRIGSAIFGKRD
jgi:pyridoxal phosphate enzyme (YggS family)